MIPTTQLVVRSSQDENRKQKRLLREEQKYDIGFVVVLRESWRAWIMTGFLWWVSVSAPLNRKHQGIPVYWWIIWNLDMCMVCVRSGINRLGLVYRPADIDFALYKKWWSIADDYFGVSIRQFDSSSDNTVKKDQWGRFVNHYFSMHVFISQRGLSILKDVNSQ